MLFEEHALGTGCSKLATFGNHEMLVEADALGTGCSEVGRFGMLVESDALGTGCSKVGSDGQAGRGEHGRCGMLHRDATQRTQEAPRDTEDAEDRGGTRRTRDGMRGRRRDAGRDEGRTRTRRARGGRKRESLAKA